MIITCYYGLLRVGGLTQSQRTIKAADIHLAKNKTKILISLRMSKTHTQADQPQLIKLMPVLKKPYQCAYFYCPYNVLLGYLEERGDFEEDDDPLFVFRNGTPVKPDQFRRILHKAIKTIGLNPSLYNYHSLRIGRATDFEKEGMKVEKIRKFGCRKSNTVYKYLGEP